VRLPAGLWFGEASQNQSGPSEDKSHSPEPGGDAGEEDGAAPRSSRHQPFESGVDEPMIVGTPRSVVLPSASYQFCKRSASAEFIPLRYLPP